MRVRLHGKRPSAAWGIEPSVPSPLFHSSASKCHVTAHQAKLRSYRSPQYQSERINPSIRLVLSSEPPFFPTTYSITWRERIPHCSSCTDCGRRSRLPFHRSSDLREIKQRHAAQPLHGDLLFAIGPLDRLRAHAEFRRRFLHREQILLHAQSFLSVRRSTAPEFSHRMRQSTAFNKTSHHGLSPRRCELPQCCAQTPEYSPKDCRLC